MIHVILICLAWCLSPELLHARRTRRQTPVAPVVTASTQEALPTIDDLAGAYGENRVLLDIVKKAERDMEALRRSAEREREALQGKLRQQEAKDRDELEEVKLKKEERRLRLKKEIDETVDEIAQKEELRKSKILKETERQAAELKKRFEEQTAEDRLAGRIEIASEWRREIIRDFDRDCSFIRQVVMEGESSRVERQNFLALFQEQKEWFEKKAAEAKFFFDEPYTALMSKRNAVAVVVDAQRQADDCILDLVSEYHFPAKVQAQLRLMTLYEINNHIQHSRNDPTVFLSSDVIENLVDKVSVDVAPGRKDFKIISYRDKAKKLEERIADLEQQLLKPSKPEVDETQAAVHQERLQILTRQLEGLKQERDDMLARASAQEALHLQERTSLVDLLEQKERNKAEMEIQLAHTKEQLYLLTNQSQQHLHAVVQELSHKQITEQELVQALESKARRQAELEVSLAQVSQEIDRLRQTSAEVTQTLMDKLNNEQDRCHTLSQLLEEKQRELVLQEIEARKAQEVSQAALVEVERQTAAYQTLHESREHFRSTASMLQEECARSRGEVESLRKQLVSLKEHDARTAADFDAFQEQVKEIMEKTEIDVGCLKEIIHDQNKELQHRRDAYAQMHELQKKLEKMRAKKDLLLKHSVAHLQLLSQMSTFGENLLADYNKLQSAMQNIEEVNKRLSGLFMSMHYCKDDLHQAEFLRALDATLELLSETSMVIAESVGKHQKRLAEEESARTGVMPPPLEAPVSTVA